MSRSLTYAEIAEALNITPASANRLARRKRWPRVKGNDGRARVSVPDGALVRSDRPPDSPEDRPPDRLPDNAAHARLVTALESHIKTLQAENEALREQLAAERERVDKAISAFAALAERLDALAAERARPWWRRRPYTF